MAPASPSRPPSFLTRSILGLATAHIATGIAVQIYSSFAHDPAILRLYFDYEATLVLLVFGILQLSCAFLAYRELSADRPLALAWLYILAASACTLVSTVFTQFLAVDTFLNPLPFWLGGNSTDARALIGTIGTVVGGPVQIVLLGTGLYLALRLYWKLGLVPDLRPVDLGPVGIVTFYAVLVLAGILKTVRNASSSVTAEQLLHWAGDVVLCLVLVEAVFLFRSAREAGWGYLSKVWTAFAIAISLTGICSLAEWLRVYGAIGKWDAMLITYLWYARCAALAVAPALQWEAIRVARKMSRRTNEFGIASPVRPNPN